ncbi:hypothetical protein BSKO_02790 [Bryopsis sp. KO-2023]|nr:hypothetical protein BSKO_02790 [Bryopsis sp. KO-2023]
MGNLVCSILGYLVSSILGYLVNSILGKLVSSILTSLQGPAPSTMEWDLPEGVLCQIFDLLPIKQLAQSCLVTKRWRTLISENHDLKLEKAWRTGKITPKRSCFGREVLRSAKNGDMVAVYTMFFYDGYPSGIAIMDLRNDDVYFRAGVFCQNIFRFVDGVLFSDDKELGVVRGWDVPEITEKVSFKIPEKVIDLADVGEHIAVCGWHGYLGFWKKEDWTPSQVLQIECYSRDIEENERITCFTYFKGLFYCGLHGGEISVFSEENADLVAKFHVHDLELTDGYLIYDGFLIGVYLTVDKLTIVNSKGEVLQFDFGSMDE